MSKKIKQFIKDNIILIFVFFILFMVVAGIIYYSGLNPNNKNINDIIKNTKQTNILYLFM